MLKSLTLAALATAALCITVNGAGAAEPSRASGAAKSPPPKEAPGQGRKPADRGQAVARVNGVPIYKADFDAALTRFMQEAGLGQAASDTQRQEAHKTVMDGLIGSELLYQKATASSVPVSQEEVDKAVAQYRSSVGEETFASDLKARGMVEDDVVALVRQNLMVQKLIQDVLSQTTVSEEEVQTFYKANISLMKKPEGVEVSHILVKSRTTDSPEQKAEARKRIDEALRRVKAGEDFGAVAKSVSEDGSAAAGGALGTIRRGQTVPAFEEAAFKVPVGQLSDVVESPFGFHVLKVTGREEPAVATIEEAHDRIAEHLKQGKSRETLDRMVSSLRAGAKIEIL